MTAERLVRSVPLLRRAAGLVLHDLTTTFDGTWACDVTDEHVLVVRWDQQVEQVALDPYVDADAWPAEAYSARYLESTLEDDAFEVVTSEVQEVLRLWGVRWPRCVTHDADFSSCSGVWACGSGTPHDVLVGALDRASTSAAQAKAVGRSPGPAAPPG